MFRVGIEIRRLIIIIIISVICRSKRERRWKKGRKARRVAGHAILVFSPDPRHGLSLSFTDTGTWAGISAGAES